jgi:serine protease Do
MAAVTVAPAQPQVVNLSKTGGSYIGVGLAEVDAVRAKELKLREERGVEITWVEQDSPAEKAGLKKGDVVLEYNGQRVEGIEQFSRFVRETPVGREAKLLVSRDGATQTLAVKIGARKSSGLSTFSATPRLLLPEKMTIPDEFWGRIEAPRMSWRSSMLGVEGESLSGQLAAYFGVKEGVLVRNVASGSPAEKAGMKAGDVITKVDDSMVTSPSEVSAALRQRGERKTVQVTLMRDRKAMTLSVNLEDGWADHLKAGRETRRL